MHTPSTDHALPGSGNRLRALLAALVLGAGIGFAVAYLVMEPAAADPPPGRTIVLTPADRAQIAANLAEVQGGPPTQAELGAAIEDRVREEVFYREALRRGLGRGDPVVRKRLARLMEGAAADASDDDPPDQATLRRWLRDHPDRFAQDLRLGFDQVFFETRPRAVVGRALIEGGADWARVGDPSRLPAAFADAGRPAVAREMGEDFAIAIEGLRLGRAWQGPVESTLGWHLVRLRSREPGTIPAFETVRDRVEADWRAATAATRADAAYEALRRRYTVQTGG
ncbi:peptidyl-prolyl cis-trans isomerase [Tsuneonella amylolytica]|uniref:peptidylprolyl isomerase n=1 Tax=Tsuneonella amylolytica TaxID=2338327 RepID=UPI0013C4BF58|nr:peptidylprolyl isomerase [Tsuneonella amylolytica]